MQQFDKQLKLSSVDDKPIVCVHQTERSDKCSQIETRSQTQTQNASLYIKPEDNQIKATKEEQTSKETLIDENQTKQKTVIKGRKILRKAERLRDQVNTEESDEREGEVKEEEAEEEKESKSTLSIEMEDKSEKCFEPKIETPIQTKQTQRVDIKLEEYKIVDNREDEETEDIKTEIQTKEQIYGTVVEKSEENETIEAKTIIKGRKLLRKADRLREQTNTEESEILEQKKIEVLNKLSNLSEREDTSKWNNWFTDIKSAAMAATSTTVTHVSQASNKWSLNPKSLLTSAASITSNVGMSFT